MGGGWHLRIEKQNKHLTNTGNYETLTRPTPSLNQPFGLPLDSPKDYLFDLCS